MIHPHSRTGPRTIWQLLQSLTLFTTPPTIRSSD
jgi:hypothetical protein